MLIDYLTVAAALAVMFATITVNTRGWEALQTQKGMETVILIPLLWPIIASCILLIVMVIAIIITFVLVHELVNR